MQMKFLKISCFISIMYGEFLFYSLSYTNTPCTFSANPVPGRSPVFILLVFVFLGAGDSDREV